MPRGIPSRSIELRINNTAQQAKATAKATSEITTTPAMREARTAVELRPAAFMTSISLANRSAGATPETTPLTRAMRSVKPSTRASKPKSCMRFNTDPRDPVDIAEKIRRGVEDTDLQGNLIQRGLARVRLFTWQRTAEETLRVYDEVVE